MHQQAHAVETTSYQRQCDVTSHWRWYNVVFSCVLAGMNEYMISPDHELEDCIFGKKDILIFIAFVYTV